MAATRVIVYDTRIAGLFDPGENAVEFTKDVIDDIIAAGQRTAPRGGPTSGNRRAGGVPLWKMHKSSGVLRRGPYGAGGSAYNSARHAEWVHNGVQGRIFPTNGRHLAVPVAPGTGVRRATATLRNRNLGREIPARRGVVLVKSVRGQDANPWLAEAGNAVVARRRAQRYYRNWAKGGTRLTGGSGS